MAKRKKKFKVTIQEVFLDWNGEEYRTPGTGALEYTKQITDGLRKDEAARVIVELLAGNIHDNTNERVKRCGFCRYYYCDKTKPNNSRTCSAECKVSFDTSKRRKKREPFRKLTEKETFYNPDLGLWACSEERMVKHFSRMETVTDKIEQLIALRELSEEMGGKKRVTTSPAI